MRRVGRSVSAVAAVGALVVAGLAAAPSALAANHRKPVPHSQPAWVAHSQSLGRVAAKKSSTFRVYLAPDGGIDALKADVARVSNPRSADYRHFLTAAQYHARYDASGATVRTVTSWLRSNHLRVTSVEPHHRYLGVRGTNAAVEQAFATTIKRFRHRGHLVQANTSTLTVPATVAPFVLAVTGLDTTPHIVQHQSPPPAGFRNARPCSAYYGQLKAKTQADHRTPLPKFKHHYLPYAPCGYTGPQYRTAYQGANPDGLDGSGVTVAITDAYASRWIAKDAQRYATEHGDGGYGRHQLKQVLPRSYRHQGLCGPSGWYGEETLDVEAVHAMAPGAKIRYYASRSCFDNDFLATLAKVVDQNKASIVSNSWGDLEQNETTDNIAAYEQVFLQGAMQGIGFLYSSGDGGDELQSSGLKQTDYPTSDPFVTSVGGTSDAIGADGSLMWQTGWGTDKYALSDNQQSWEPQGYLYGAGGGHSSLFNRPAYQDGVVPPSNGSGRAVPDVGLDADPTTGMLVGQTQDFPDGRHYGEYRIGGTSLASPLFAGDTALRQQAAGGRLGFLNPSIYESASTFRDVKGRPKDAGNIRVDYANGVNAKDGLLYSVRTFNQDSSLHVRRGWDDITGVGSPDQDWIAGP